MTIPLEPWVGRLRTVRAAIERRPVTLLFDTGGGETLVASRVLEGVGCASEGRAVGFRMSGERVEWARCRGFPLEVAGTTLLPRTVGVFDVMPLFGDQLPQGTPPVGGVLSLDAARGRRLTLDLASLALILESDSSFLDRTSRMHEVPARIATGGAKRSLGTQGSLIPRRARPRARTPRREAVCDREGPCAPAGTA